MRDVCNTWRCLSVNILISKAAAWLVQWSLNIWAVNVMWTTCAVIDVTPVCLSSLTVVQMLSTDNWVVQIDRITDERSATLDAKGPSAVTREIHMVEFPDGLHTWAWIFGLTVTWDFDVAWLMLLTVNFSCSNSVLLEALLTDSNGSVSQLLEAAYGNDCVYCVWIK